MNEIQSINKFFYSTKYIPTVSETFCSYMKNLKSDEKVFYNLALSLSEKIEPFKNGFDVFVSVPKYQKTDYETDYAEKLVHILSSKLNIPYKKGILSKIKDTKKLKILPDSERISEISSAFKLNDEKYKRICLVDDVYSSGATVGEIIKTFNKCGIIDISVAVLVLQSQNKL
ncbi:MAG: hypothetical protein PHR82_09770 [Endomicrobiaceae bacterium]|nr:hypothetical protein [Endomicrobiaceae bacterium]